jgi:hypothetical protein
MAAPSLPAHAGGRRPALAGLSVHMMRTRAPASGGGARVLQPLRLSALADSMMGEHAEGGGPAPKSSSYTGVSWYKRNSVWEVSLYDSQNKGKQYIGSYASEEDAARAYDCAAVKLLGLDTKRNFPDEIISEPPASRGDAMTSSFNGVSWDTRDSVWRVTLYNPQTKRRQNIGSCMAQTGPSATSRRAHHQAAGN